MTLDEAIRHCEEVAERYDRVEDSHADDGLKQECIQCAADHRQLAEWLTELKEAKVMILDTSYTLEVMCDKVSTKIGCKHCTYYDEETHGCEVRKWIDKMRTFAKGRR